MNNVETMRKRIEEIQESNDKFISKLIPGFDPAKAKAARENLLELLQKSQAAQAEKKARDAEKMKDFQNHLRELIQNGAKKTEDT